MKKIVFSHSTGWGEHNKTKEVFEFKDEATDEEINEAFEEWVWSRVGDSVTWYEEGEAE